MTLARLLGVPDGEGEVKNAMMASRRDDFSLITVADIRDVSAIMIATEPEPLAIFAAVCAVGGMDMVAASYIALFRISQLFVKNGSGTLRGYSSFTSFVDDFVGPDIPFSRSSIFQKVNDISVWQSQGTSWDTIRRLLSNTPMAGRDAITLLIEPQKNETIIDSETGEIVEQKPSIDGEPVAEYLDQLSMMGPGEARRDVRDKAGVPERYVKEAAYVTKTRTLLLHCVWEYNDVDVAATDIDEEVARWLCSKLSVGMNLA